MVDMHQITGHAIFTAGPPMREFLTLGFGTELIYSFIIIICSLMVYFGTKEIYELSSYKGIKYFRNAFLFFAAAYFVRSFIKFFVMYFNVNTILEISPRTFGFFGQITLLLYVYFSAMAVFYILYSVQWKKYKPKRIWIFHVLAGVTAIISIIFNNPAIYLLINLILFIFLSAAVLISHKESKKKKSKLYLIYILLFVFWALNILDILIPNFLQTYKLLIYMSSITIFLLILYRVLKNSGAN